MPEETTVAELMNSIPDYFVPENAKGISMSVQFLFSGEKGGDWGVWIKDGSCTVEEETIENPSLTLMTTTEDALLIFSGKMDPMTAYTFGKLKFRGNVSLAMKMMNYFKMPR